MNPSSLFCLDLGKGDRYSCSTGALVIAVGEVCSFEDFLILGNQEALMFWSDLNESLINIVPEVDVHPLIGGVRIHRSGRGIDERMG